MDIKALRSKRKERNKAFNYFFKIANHLGLNLPREIWDIIRTFTYSDLPSTKDLRIFRIPTYEILQSLVIGDKFTPRYVRKGSIGIFYGSPSREQSRNSWIVLE